MTDASDPMRTKFAESAMTEKPDVFMSHASPDKVTFVRPLAEALLKLGVAVWYDEFSLELGDSISQQIDRGIANSRFGIVVVSPALLLGTGPSTNSAAL